MAEQEIRQHMVENDFDSYEILERRHNLVPSYFEYHIRFYEEPIEGSEQ